jgi:peptidyl-prolyl cis-trans isomerase D
MLKVFRDNLKYLSWVLWAVIAVFVFFVFVDFGGVSGGLRGSGTEAAATVGSRTVSYDDYQRQYQNLERSYRQLYGEGFTSEVAEQFGLKQRALEQAVNQLVLLDEAERLGLGVSDDEVREVIRELPGLQKENGGFVGMEEYRAALSRMGYSPDRFEREIRQGLLLERLQQILSDSIWVAEAEVEEAYREQVERADVRWVQQPAAGLGGEVDLPRAELAAYLEEHHEEFQLPEQRRAAYLLVESARMRDQIEIPDAEVRAYYDGHADEFTQEEQVQARHVLLRVGEDRSAEQARQQLDEIRARIAGGEGFAQVASEVSEDPGSAARGGHLGFFGRGRMTPEFEEAAFAAPVGELVGPIETPFGVHLLEVTERRQAGLQPFEEVSTQIRNRMLGERVLEVSEERAKELSAELRQDGDEVAAAELRQAAEGDEALVFQQVGPFGREDLIPGIGRSPEFVGAVFGLEQGKLSEPVRVPRGYALALVEEVLAPRAPTLDEVLPRVRQAAEAERRQQLAMERLGNAAADVAEAKATFEQAVTALGLEPQQSGEFGRGGAIPGLGFHPVIAEAAMELEAGEVGGPFGTSQGAVLFEVTSRTRWDPEQFAGAREGVRQQIEQDRLNRLLAALIEQRKLELGVSYDRRLVDELGLAPA